MEEEIFLSKVYPTCHLCALYAHLTLGVEAKG
jgi:hypothetical protein